MRHDVSVLPARYEPTIPLDWTSTINLVLSRMSPYTWSALTIIYITHHLFVLYLNNCLYVTWNFLWSIVLKNHVLSNIYFTFLTLYSIKKITINTKVYFLNCLAAAKRDFLAYEFLLMISGIQTLVDGRDKILIFPFSPCDHSRNSSFHTCQR